MHGSLMVGSWVEIHEGCTIRFEIGGSGIAFVTCGGDSDETFQFAFDSEALREFLRVGSGALREMDATYAREEADAERDSANFDEFLTRGGSEDHPLPELKD